MGFFVDSNGQKGGLALFWSSELNLRICSFSQGYIDALVSFDGFQWRFTRVYGKPKQDIRQPSWELLRRLQSLFDCPWLCYGDFNEILSTTEKTSALMWRSSLIESFRSVDFCGFHDLGFKGSPFTWFNNQLDNTFVHVLIYSLQIMHEKIDFRGLQFVTLWRDVHITFLFTSNFNNLSFIMIPQFRNVHNLIPHGYIIMLVKKLLWQLGLLVGLS